MVEGPKKSQKMSSISHTSTGQWGATTNGATIMIVTTIKTKVMIANAKRNKDQKVILAHKVIKEISVI